MLRHRGPFSWFWVWGSGPGFWRPALEGRVAENERYGPFYGGGAAAGASAAEHRPWPRV